MTWPPIIRTETRVLRTNVRMDDLIDSLTRSRVLKTPSRAKSKFMFKFKTSSICLVLTTRARDHCQFGMFAKLSTKLARLGAPVSATDLPGHSKSNLLRTLAIFEGASYKVDLSLSVALCYI